MPYTAIFGGTFNPFHIGHYEMLKALCEMQDVSRVLVMPDKIPPHKLCDFLADDADRIEMCRIVCKDFSKAELCLVEFEREGKSYTVDTLKALKKVYPNENFAVACGGDMIASLDTWSRFDELKKLCTFLTFNRGENQGFKQDVTKMRRLGADIVILDTEITAVSSTELRKRPIRTLLPQGVFEYMIEKGVYLNKNIPEYAEYKQLLKSRLTEKRYFHSLCVADEAYRLAEKYGADSGKAYLAGLLHDITKNAPVDEHLNIFETFGIIQNDIEKSAQKLWHAMSGAAYVKYVLNIKDDEIYDAIRYHTTAKADISLLSKIIYLADFTSADRDYEDVEVIRGLVDNSLDDAYFYALCFSVGELVDKKRAIHTDTIAAYNETAMKRKESN